MKVLVLGTTVLCMAIGAGAASATSQSSTTSYATALPACFSKTSPMLDSHYGYDDRDCSEKIIEGRAVYLNTQTSDAQETQSRFATSLPACLSKTSPILTSHYGYDDRDCFQS